jgi:hypothetical protein
MFYDGTHLHDLISDASLQGKVIIKRRVSFFTRECVALEWMFRVQARAWLLVRARCPARCNLWDARLQASSPNGAARLLHDREAIGWYLRRDIRLPEELAAREAEAFHLGSAGDTNTKLVHTHIVPHEVSLRDRLAPCSEQLQRVGQRWLLFAVWLRSGWRNGERRWGLTRPWCEELTAYEAEKWCSAKGIITTRCVPKLTEVDRCILLTLRRGPRKGERIADNVRRLMCGLGSFGYIRQRLAKLASGEYYLVINCPSVGYQLTDLGWRIADQLARDLTQT